MESINPYSELGESPRAKKFMKHVILAAKKQEEKLKAKQGLEKQVEKVRKVATTKTKKGTIEKELDKLETKLNEVLEKEGKLIITGQKDTKLTEFLKDEIIEVENKIQNLESQDAKVIETLKDQIERLEYELNVKEYNREVEEGSKKYEIENINNAIVELREKLKQSIIQKTEREKRVEELEKRIKEKVGKNYDEILKLEKQLKDMEEKYELVKKKGNQDPNSLKRIEEKLDLTKNKIMFKKAGIDEGNMTFTPKIKIEPKRPLFIKKQSIPMKRKLFVKHNMDIKPVENFQPTEKELPPLPLIQEKKMLPPSPRDLIGLEDKFPEEKPGIFKRFFRKIFGKKSN